MISPIARLYLSCSLLLPLLGACRSTGVEDPGPNLIGAQPDESDWTILSRSGDEPDWKDREESGFFWGEGRGRSEAAALAAAEQDMRRKAAEFLETRVRSEFEIEQRQVDDRYSERARGQVRASTDQRVRSLAVEDSYRELRQKEVRAFGEEHRFREHRALVRGRLP